MEEKKKNLNVGDLVLLVEEDIPRGKWMTGRVRKIYKGEDNLVRVVDVEMEGGLYRRAIHTIFLGVPNAHGE